MKGPIIATILLIALATPGTQAASIDPQCTDDGRYCCPPTTDKPINNLGICHARACAYSSPCNIDAPDAAARVNP